MTPHLADYGAALQRNRWLILFLVTFAILMSYVAVAGKPREYEARLSPDLSGRANGTPMETEIGILNTFAQKAKARVERTAGVRIVARAGSSKQATDVVRGVLQAYRDFSRTAAQPASTPRQEAKLDDLKRAMLASEAQLRRAEAQVEGKGGKRKKPSKAIAELEKLHAQALAAREDAESAYEAIRAGRLGDVAGLAPLLARREEAHGRFEGLKKELGENHPTYQTLAGQLKALDEAIEAARRQFLETAYADWAYARKREAALRDELSAAHAREIQSTGGRIRFDDARLQAESDRKLYEMALAASHQAAGPAVVPETVLVEPVTVVAIERRIFDKCAGAGGLALLAVLGILWLRPLDRRIRRLTDLHHASHLPILGVLPLGTSSSAGVGGAAFEAAVESLSQSILALANGDQGKSILLASPLQEEGRSTVSAALAGSLARAGKRLLLIDANLRRPVLDRMLTGAAVPAGLGIALAEQEDWRRFLVTDASQPGLDLLPAGPAGETSVAQFERGIPAVLAEAAREYDLILLDSASFLEHAESVDLAVAADAVIVLVRAGQTPESRFHGIASYLNRLNSKVAGTVLNAA